MSWVPFRMAVRIRSFFDLLPFRIDQAVVGGALRKRRVRRKRGAFTLAGGHAPKAPGRLFVDVTMISKHDAGTGIQRVVRALAIGLTEEAPDGWSIHFVSAGRRTRYGQVCWPIPHPSRNSTQLEGRPGDVFLALDYSLDTIRWHRAQLERFRRTGGSIWFLVHDLLPLQHPDWFSRNTVIRYKAWLDIIAGLADGFLCNSPQTEHQLEQVLRARYGITGGYRIGVVPMGASVRDSMLLNATEVRVAAPQLDKTIPFNLMVGTLEPRKGHMDVITAFGELWKLGRQDRLVLVGRLGWQVEDLCNQILSHPEYGKKLIWLDDVNDLELEDIYAACEGVIMASYAEGFGLPLLEALGHGKPVLARDLAVFRTHEPYGVSYFPTTADASALANSIAEWIDNVRGHRVRVTRPDACWRKSAKEVIRFIALEEPA